MSRKTIIGTVSVLVVLVLGGIVVWRALGPREAGEIKIGAVMPLTGELATYGTPVRDGMLLALQEINETGRINGRDLKIVFEDDQGQPRVAVTAFQKLIDIEKTPIILGPLTSSASLATAPIAEKRKVVQLSTIAGTIQLKTAGDYVFRLFASDEYQGIYLAKVAMEKFGAKKASILYVNNAYGQGIRQVVEETFVKNGGQILSSEAVNEGAGDFRVQIAKIKSLNPDLVFGLLYYNDGAKFLIQAKNLGLKTKVLGGDAWFGPIAETAKGATDLLVFSSIAFGPQHTDQKKMQEFITKYKQKFGKDADSYAATGYDAVYVAKYAIEKSGYSSDGIKNALYKVKDFSGALGKITFDQYGDNVGAEFDLFVIRDGETVPYRK